MPAPVVSSKLSPGAVIDGRYVLRERLAEGGMGVVYRADHVALTRTVAIKFLHPEVSAMPELLARFHREAEAASRLSHPNIVDVIDFGVTDAGAPFLVMEYVRGDDLSDLLRREGIPPLSRTLAIVEQILAALGDAHAAGVVHGDVTCGNILVEHLAGGTDLVKVVDFGLARLRDGETLPSDGTLLVGTPEYLAPEVIAGHAPTAASDLYAVGVILYELLTGSPPFADDTTLEVLQRQLADVVVPPSLRCPQRDIPGAVDEMCVRALGKRATDRFPDAATFHRAIRALQPFAELAGGDASIPSRTSPEDITQPIELPLSGHRMRFASRS